MLYYIAGVILLTKISDIVSIGDKVYKICNGVYHLLSYSKSMFQNRPLLIENNNVDDENEWIELKTFKSESCQTGM